MTDMFKISVVEESHHTRILKLEGRLLFPSIATLTDACQLAGVDGRQVRLDLRDLSYADVAGAITLGQLMRDGFDVIGTSPYIGALLKDYTS